MIDPEAGWAKLPGAPAPPCGNDVVDWITGSTGNGRTITSAIPPTYVGYATVVIPDGHAEKTRSDAALVGVLRVHTQQQPWWLGYLDTGVADVVAADVPRVAVYAGWLYVLLGGSPDQALSSRRNSEVTPWHSALPS